MYSKWLAHEAPNNHSNSNSLVWILCRLLTRMIQFQDIVQPRVSKSKLENRAFYQLRFWREAPSTFKMRLGTRLFDWAHSQGISPVARPCLVGELSCTGLLLFCHFIVSALLSAFPPICLGLFSLVFLCSSCLSVGCLLQSCVFLTWTSEPHRPATVCSFDLCCLKEEGCPP